MQKTITENERLKKQNQELQQENLKLREIIKKAGQLIKDALNPDVTRNYEETFANFYEAIYLLQKM